jgi:hypothetical protein
VQDARVLGDPNAGRESRGIDVFAEASPDEVLDVRRERMSVFRE